MGSITLFVIHMIIFFTKSIIVRNIFLYKFFLVYFRFWYSSSYDIFFEFPGNSNEFRKRIHILYAWFFLQDNCDNGDIEVKEFRYFRPYIQRASPQLRFYELLTHTRVHHLGRHLVRWKCGDLDTSLHTYSENIKSERESASEDHGNVLWFTCLSEQLCENLSY